MLLLKWEGIQGLELEHASTDVGADMNITQKHATQLTLLDDNNGQSLKTPLYIASNWLIGLISPTVNILHGGLMSIRT